MTSHEWAIELNKTANLLLSKPEVEMETNPYVFAWFYDKERFLSAVRAFGQGKKQFTEHDFKFSVDGTVLTMTIARSKVCRKVQEEKWECEPLLSEEEVETL